MTRTTDSASEQSVIWHDLECGAYRRDLPVWLRLAAAQGDPILDVGAGAGRVTLELARRDHRVTALDLDAELLAELKRRAGEIPVETVCADARGFELDKQFALCIVPMQTVQLLGGSAGRGSFLACVSRHLRIGGVLAVAISAELDLFDSDDGAVAPAPDVGVIEGITYRSQPTAVRADRGGFVLERRRETITPEGQRSTERDEVRLDAITPDQLESEIVAAGLTPQPGLSVPATRDHVGSTVVIAHA